MRRLLADVSLRVKLLGWFGAVLTLTVILGVVMLSEVGAVNAGSVYIATDSLPSIEAIDQIQAEENGYRADQLWNITNTDLRLSRAPIAAATAASARIQAAFHRYRSMLSNAQDAHLLATAQSQWTAYTGSTGRLLLASSNTTQPNTVALANSSAAAFNALRPTVARWVALNDDLAKRNAAANASTYNSARALGFALLLAALAFELGIALLVALDVTRRKHAERELDRLAQAAEHGADAIISIDLQGRIQRWNEGAERLYGFSAAQALGRPAHELTMFSDEPAEHIERVLAGEGDFQYESRRRRADGSVIDTLSTVLPWHLDGKLVGITGVTVNITERKDAERAREQALADLEEAQRFARLGAWTWDFKTGEASWSAHTYELFGRNPASGPATGDVLALYVHPEDRQRIKDFATDPNRGAFEFDFRILAGQERQERVLHAIGREVANHPGAYRGTFQDITDRLRGEQAEAANQAKNEFLSRMSHELRTPLNAISGFGQLLAMDALSPDQAEHVNYVLKGANHMLALVDDVLDFSRIEAEQLRVSAEPVALIGAVGDALALIAPLAAEAEITLTLHTDGLSGDEHVHADARRLGQVLLNVLSNAVKYNRPGGRVDVSFERVAGAPARVRVLVSDTGIGIAPENLAKLFEPFERLGIEKRAIDGTGLGLALSKRLLQAMDATITACSELGVGSTFAIELAGAPAPRAGAAEHERAPQPVEPAPQRSKVLYIEDNVSNLKLAERILERLGAVDMVPAMQGSLGLALAREHPPDVILLDLHLPDMPGEEVLKRLKAEPETRAIPVIVLTADASKGTSERLKELGACEFLSKPFNVQQFMTVVGHYLGGAGSKRPA